MQVVANYAGQMLAMLVLAASLNLVLGYAGIFTAAQAAFGAVGGYALIWLTSAHGYSFIAAMLIGIGVAGIFGLLIGYAALRLEMTWLLLLTLAVQLVMVDVLSTIGTFGGSQGMESSSLTIFGHALLTPTQVLPICAVGAVIVFALCYRIGESPYGRVLRGIREDESAARSLGKNVFRYKVSIFVVTAMMAAFGGVLLSAQTSVASPTLYGFDVSVEIIAMVMIGGQGNMFGSILGVAIVVLATPFFENVIHLSTSASGFWQAFAYGLLLVLVICFRPQGLIPEGTSLRRWVRDIARLPGAVVAALSRSSGVKSEATAVAASANGSGTLVGGAVPSGGGGPGGSLGTVQIGHGFPGSPRERVVPELKATSDAGARGDVIVEVKGISKSFGGVHAVSDLNMELRRGMITALVGPNGAGKTTVFNLLTGALPLDAGRVYLGGQDVTGLTPDAVTKLGMARSFQDVRVFPKLSVVENVMLGVPGQCGEHMWNLFARPMQTSRDEKAARARAHEWLRFIEMDDLAQVHAGSLSFGQQKLVALARILATESDVLLLDEPGSGVDHVWIDEMIGIIKDVRDAGRTVCIVEHNLDVVGRLAEHVYFMELGSVTAEGTFEDLTNDPRLTEAYFGTV